MEGRAPREPPLADATAVRDLSAACGPGRRLVALLPGRSRPGFCPAAPWPPAAGPRGRATPAWPEPSAAEWARLRALAGSGAARRRPRPSATGRRVRQAAAGPAPPPPRPAGRPGRRRGPSPPSPCAPTARRGWAPGSTGLPAPLTVLAGIGRIESNHGLFGGAATRFSAAGTVSPRITGPPLDGNGVASIPDSDGGRWDGDATWDRAVGPMQFIPTTWRSLGRDGNGDRVADPNNLFDAAVSAAGYLCLGGDGDLTDPARLRQAIYGYNHSWAYVDAVLGWARLYQGGVATGPAVPSGAAPSTTATPPTGPPATDPPAPPDHHHLRPARRTPDHASRRPTTPHRPPTTTATHHPGPPTTGSPTTTTEPCQPTTTSTTSGEPTTTTSTTTTTTTPGGSTTTTTLPPCG